MERIIEKRMITMLGIWQIIDGLITIIGYGFLKYGPLSNKFGANMAQAQADNAVYGSMFTLVCTFGTFLIALGLFNLVIAHRYLRGPVTNKKIGFFLLGQGLISYFILDILGMILGITTGVIYFAKNKAIKRAVEQPG